MQTTALNRFTIPSALALAAVFTVSCASVPLRTEASTSGIRAAEEVGAKGVPEASLYLQYANEELKKARSLHANGEHEEATSMLMRAEADAELAVLLSRESAEKAQAKAASERVQELRRDNAKPSN